MLPRIPKYMPALNLAVEEVLKRDPLEMATCSGATHLDDGSLCLDFLGDSYVFSMEDARAKGAILPEVEVLLLRYLSSAKDVGLTGDIVSFLDLPGGVAYNMAFIRRAVRPIAKAFGSDPEAFVEAALGLSGKKKEVGDLGFSIPALSRVPLVYTLSLGDEEVPSSSGVYFDGSASLHMETEDLAVLGEIVTMRLVWGR